jgi:hypothetical protein
MTGDSLAQARIVAGNKRSIVFNFGCGSDLCMRILLGRAREITTDYLRVLSTDAKPAVLFHNPAAVANLVGLTLRNDFGYYGAVAAKAAPVDLSHLKRLQSCHIVHGLYIQSLTLPRSLTEATIPMHCDASLHLLPSLVKLTLVFANRGPVWDDSSYSSTNNLPMTWPPSLHALDVRAYFDDIYVNTLPTTLTHLGLRIGSGVSHLRRLIPVQCTLLQSLSFGSAWYSRHHRHPHEDDVQLPPSLTSLEASHLKMTSQADFDHFLDFVPRTIADFKVGMVRINTGVNTNAVNPTAEQRLKLMERVTPEYVEWHAFSFRKDHEDDEDDDALDDDQVDYDTRQLFIDGAKRILSRHGLTCERYADELVMATPHTIGASLKVLPPDYGHRLLEVAKKYYDIRLGQCKFVDGVTPREQYDSAKALFAHGYASRLWLKKRKSAPSVIMAPIFNYDIANGLERIRMSVVNRWFMEFFAGDFHYPRLKVITVEKIGHDVIISAIHAARRRMPLLEQVSLENGKRLEDVELVKMMADLRLYGFTTKVTMTTEMNYYVQPPWFYYKQLEGDFDIRPVIGQVVGDFQWRRPGK